MAAEPDADGQKRELALEPREVRVLGCLMEKELSTPDYYPMTINALRTACNQKTNREPVVDYSETDVVEALDGLQRKRLVGNASSSHGRAAKYRHALAEVMELKRSQLAVLSSLLLRGPQTSGELRSRTNRMHEFSSLDDVDETLDGLQEREPPLITEMPRRPGQKEVRYAHLFAGEPAEESAAPVAVTPTGGDERVRGLDQEVAALREAVEELTRRFETFKQQFE